VILAIFLVYFLFLTKDVWFWVLSGLIISILFNPAIGFLQKFKLSRGAATAVVYFSVLSALFFMVYWIIPVFKNEIYQISQGFPDYFNRVAPFFSSLGFEAFQSVNSFSGALNGWLIKISTSNSTVFDSITAIFGGLFLTIAIFSLAVFFSLEEKGIENAFKLVLPRKYESAVVGIWKRSQLKISGWFAARFLSMLFVGVAVALLCIIFRVNYPIFFGIFAFITDLVPFVGPLICGAVMILFVLIDTWQKAVAIGVGIVLIHQIEGNIITPMLTKRFMEFPATLVLISLLVGERLWGVVGAILAIPLFGIVYDLVRDLMEKNKD
jgi:predicted PurR-regulated permease PerM